MLALAAWFGATAWASALVILDAPGGGTDPFRRTSAQGVSGNLVAGYYNPTFGATGFRGFTYDGSAYAPLDVPLARDTFPHDVWGTKIVGDYSTAARDFGFVYDGVSFTTLAGPAGATFSRAYGIDDEQVVGFYQDAGGAHGYVYDGATYTPLNYPSATSTQAHGVFGGTLVGRYSDAGGHHGFMFDGLAYTSLDHPLGVGGTFVSDVWGSTIVGHYNDGNARNHGFIYDGSGFTTFDVPGAQNTEIYGIDGTTIVGRVTGGTFQAGRGFIATIPEPAGATAAVIAAAAALIVRRSNRQASER